MQQKISLLFLGTPDLVIPLLQTLHNHPDLHISAVITQPDKPVGRKQIITPSPVKQFAMKKSLPTLTPTKIDSSFKIQLNELSKNNRPHLAVLAAYGLIIPQWLLDYPQYGIINIHPSLLPKYRGAMPTLPPILRNEVSTGVTFMQMDEKLDHGPLIAQFESNIHSTENREQLTARLFKESAQYMIPIIENLIFQKPSPTPELKIFNPPQAQDHSQATFTSQLTKTDAFVPWELLRKTLNNQPADLQLFPTKMQPHLTDIYQPHLAALFLHQLILALVPWPNAWSTIPTKSAEIRILLKKSQYSNNRLNITELVPAGDKPMGWETFEAKYQPNN